MKKETVPTWDLSALYKSVNDPRIAQDFAAAKDKAEKFAKKYRNKITDKLTPAVFLTMMSEYEAIFLLADKPTQYTHLVFSTDGKSQENGVAVQKSMETYLSIRRLILFFNIQLSKLKPETLTKLASNPKLSDYKHFINRIVESKPHRIPEASEQIFNDKYLTSEAAFIRLFDQHFASKKFKVKIEGKEKLLSEDGILNLSYDKKRSVRKAASLAFAAGLNDDKQFLTFIHNTLIKDKSISDKYRKFKTPEAARHLDNETDQETIDTLGSVIASNYKLVHDFYRFKRKVMGLDELHVYDRYAPIGESRQNYSFNQAHALIIKAFNKFDPSFAKIAEKFFVNKWIDALPRDGKRGGAYCSGVTPDTHPVVFMNYSGKIRDVQTLAHELGHGINDYLMRKQKYTNYDVPLTLAETASVFCEMIVFDELKNTITDPKEKFALYMDKIQGIFATVFRQFSMYKFEQDIHNLQKTKSELTTEDFNENWNKRQKEMFGNSMKIGNEYDIYWSYIPHFLHTPFYVYAYSFGELVVLSLYAQYKKQGHKFVKKYITLMGSGTIASPQELLQPFGIDLKDRTFWEGGMEIIKDIIKEAKKLHKKI